jgi:hypothetical protein
LEHTGSGLKAAACFLLHSISRIDPGGSIVITLYIEAEDAAVQEKKKENK